MKPVILSPRAKSDLSDIWDYTLAEWGIDQAEKYVRELWAAMQAQAGDSPTATDISDVRKGYRKVRSGSHVIFFKLTDHGIDVVRILHQQMDFERHL
ncbi:type II toxin-antitoxin system RelE/ParE family toxin [Geothermobacter hydrogeniphilus]|uniref:Toxin n=1 Tax=Geothermobacter hydrogeniphilus TaxID=1969733 RepID=A0A2K2HAD7_9BACT|nr:type II toxin-antitoxin system RelE/ParE family toxin [Geothermobacter hydrogeniphilus]PNU20231.1 type II toxin-antitoxin system RelE/ParE family toxin [Geothermobacter hydrogeniphilus]